VRARLFWLISRIAVFGYHHFPIFGQLPGAIAIIRRDDGFIGVKRNDGYGVGFPGGLVHRGESPEAALRREVFEESGLRIVSADLKFEFENSDLYPTRVRVFEATVEGEIRSSWEGIVGVFTLDELEQGVIHTQREVVEYLKHHR
jgi:8-oxo-dGTP pyrophosphatase MutT (NUDIX family)